MAVPTWLTPEPSWFKAAFVTDKRSKGGFFSSGMRQVLRGKVAGALGSRGRRRASVFSFRRAGAA